MFVQQTKCRSCVLNGIKIEQRVSQIILELVPTKCRLIQSRTNYNNQTITTTEATPRFYTECGRRGVA